MSMGQVVKRFQKCTVVKYMSVLHSNIRTGDGWEGAGVYFGVTAHNVHCYGFGVCALVVLRTKVAQTLCAAIFVR